MACGSGHPELSKSYMDMASKLFAFTFTLHACLTAHGGLRACRCVHTFNGLSRAVCAGTGCTLGCTMLFRFSAVWLLPFTLL